MPQWHCGTLSVDVVLLFAVDLRFDTAGCVGNGAKSLLGDEFACLAAHTVALVLDTDQSVLKMLDEFQLPLGKLSGLFLGVG